VRALLTLDLKMFPGARLTSVSLSLSLGARVQSLISCRLRDAENKLSAGVRESFAAAE
jgi:hypothetical protein